MAITETIKNLFGKVLTIGTPPEKEVLYKEVIKRKVPKESAEKIMINNIKSSVKNIFSAQNEDIEVSKDIPTAPVKKVAKKKSTTTKKTGTTKKETTATAKKKTTSKTKTTKKTPTKKTVTKKTTDKKTTDKKTVTKKPITKKPVTKKSEVEKKSMKKTTTATTKSTGTKTTTEKKSTTKKKVTVSKKSTAPAKGSKRDEKIALYIKDIKKHYGEVDEAFVAIIVKNLGPSIYRKDAELVSCSDPKELDTVRRNFLIKKLGLDTSKSVLDTAIQDVCEALKGVRKKYRATFYYSLAKKFKKESVLN
jgi:flagellin-like hook-associated protein FlgL